MSSATVERLGSAVAQLLLPSFCVKREFLTDDDLPPHLREPDRQRHIPVELPLAPPPSPGGELPPPPKADERDERPADPFLRWT